MEFKETQQKNLRGISIVRKNERIFHCAISLDTHAGSKASKTEAIGLMYTKALLSGCAGYKREAFLDAVNLLGATLNVSIDRGIVTITLTATDTNMMKLLKLTEAMLLSPTFATSEVKRIARELENELHEEKEDAKTQSLYLLLNNIYDKKDRRYVSPTEEVIKTLKSVNAKDLKQFHTLATQSAWVYTFASDELHEVKVARWLKKLRDSFKDTHQNYAGEHLQQKTKRKIVSLSIPSKQNIEINLGGLLPLHMHDKEFYAFLFGLNVLGKWGGFAGRLMSTVREKEGLTYGIYARTETASLSEYGYWRIITFFAPDKVMQGLTSTLREIEHIRAKGITEVEFRRFKDIIKTSEVLLRDSLTSSVGVMHGYQLKGLHYADIKTHRERMLDVSLVEINAALRKYLDTSKLIIAAAGPVASKIKELQTLERLAKSKK